MNKVEQRWLKSKTAVIQSQLWKLHIKQSRDQIRDWIDFTIEQETGCDYCHHEMKIKELSMDHILPLDRGGKNIMHNLHLIHESCNRMKGSLNDAEFKMLLHWLETMEYNFPQMVKIIRQRLKASGYMYGRSTKA